MELDNLIENEPDILEEEWEDIKKYMIADGMNPKAFTEDPSLGHPKEEQSFRKCQRMLMNMSKRLHSRTQLN